MMQWDGGGASALSVRVQYKCTDRRLLSCSRVMQCDLSLEPQQDRAGGGYWYLLIVLASTSYRHHLLQCGG